MQHPGKLGSFIQISGAIIPPKQGTETDLLRECRLPFWEAPDSPTSPGESEMAEFERNVLAYQEALPRLLADRLEGQHVLLHDGSVQEVFLSEEAAQQAGYDRFGRREFMTKEVLGSDVGMEQYLTECSG